jgi:alpha-N-arabinofuranosidase
VSGTSFAVDPTGFAKPEKPILPAPIACFDWFEYSGRGDRASASSTWRDEFDSAALRPQWLVLRTAGQPWADLTSRPGWLTLHALHTPLESPRNKSFLGRRQGQLAFDAVTELATPSAPGVSVGLAIYQDENSWYFLGVRRHMTEGAGRPSTPLSTWPLELFLERRDGKQTQTVARRDIKAAEHLELKIAVDARVSFYFTDDASGWKPLLEKADAVSNPNGGGRFAGALVGLYARAD